MKYLIKLLTYLKYTLVPPFAGILLWFSLKLTQGLFQYMIGFVNQRQDILSQQIVVTDMQTGGQSVVSVLGYLNNYMYVFFNFILKFVYYLDKWINVEFIISWGVYIMVLAMVLVIARLVLKIITVGQF